MASDAEIQSLFGQFKEAHKRLKEAVGLKEETDIKRKEKDREKQFFIILSGGIWKR